MHMPKTLLVFLSMLIVLGLKGQEVNNSLAPISIGVQPFYKATYENDLFRTEDFGNTQNICLEYAHSNLNKFFLNWVLPSLKQGVSISGLAIEHNVYTPQNLASKEIQKGDYPYAATLIFRYFTISLDTDKHIKISSNIDLGLIGPLAGGKEMQTTIHRTTGDVIPQGWDNQIAHDMVLNYAVNMDKLILSLPSYFLLSTLAGLQVGSLKTNANVGLSIMAGFFDNPFEIRTIKQKKVQAYFYNTVQIYTNLYNATLQGGLFNTASVYSINSRNLERFQLKNTLGIGLKFGSYTVSYYNLMYTKPYKVAQTKLNGGLTFGKRF